MKGLWQVRILVTVIRNCVFSDDEASSSISHSLPLSSIYSIRFFSCFTGNLRTYLHAQTEVTLGLLRRMGFMLDIASGMDYVASRGRHERGG